MLDDLLVGGFFHWVVVYDGIMTNLYGQDREDAMAVIDDDAAFDQWMEKYNEKRKLEAAEMARAQQGKPGQKLMSKDQYLRQFAKIHGGDEE